MFTTVETIKVILLGIIQGITEWLPISSTGHMILFEHWFPLDFSSNFTNLFFIFIQIGSVLAVIILFIKVLNPYHPSMTPQHRQRSFTLWIKIAVASLPAAIIGFMFNDIVDLYLFNPPVIAFTLVLYGVLFILVEKQNIEPTITKITDIGFKEAFLIGIFQTFAIIPGTSRSGSTIIGALWLGCSRTVAAEFSFFMSIPVLFGYGMVKFLKAGFMWTTVEWSMLALGFVVSFLVSIIAIKLLMTFVKKHSFTVFAYYRFALAALVIVLLVFVG